VAAYQQAQARDAPGTWSDASSLGLPRDRTRCHKGGEWLALLEQHST
jgi:hypothetical protein